MPQAHLHAILDLILRHTSEGQRLYSRPDGSRLQPGDTLRLPDLAETLALVAAHGAAVLYTGELSSQIVDTVAEGGGQLTPDDLATYEVVWRDRCACATSVTRSSRIRRPPRAGS